MADTTNFGWTKPTPDGDTGVWDTILNTLFDDVDTDLNTVKGTADAALPKAGGVMTGEVEQVSEQYALVDKGGLGANVVFDVDEANVQVGTVVQDTSPTFTDWPASGKALFFTLELTNGGAHTVSWPAAVEWDGGSAPALQTSGVDVLVFYSRDGGTTIRGMHSYSRSS